MVLDGDGNAVAPFWLEAGGAPPSYQVRLPSAGYSFLRVQARGGNTVWRALVPDVGEESTASQVDLDAANVTETLIVEAWLSAEGKKFTQLNPPAYVGDGVSNGTRTLIRRDMATAGTPAQLLLAMVERVLTRSNTASTALDPDFFGVPVLNGSWVGDRQPARRQLPPPEPARLRRRRRPGDHQRRLRRPAGGGGPALPAGRLRGSGPRPRPLHGRLPPRRAGRQLRGGEPLQVGHRQARQADVLRRLDPRRLPEPGAGSGPCRSATASPTPSPCTTTGPTATRRPTTTSGPSPSTCRRGIRLGYKYTWGTRGAPWTGSEEWPGNSRLLEVVDVNGDNFVYRRDVFGDEATNKDKANLSGSLSGNVITWTTDLHGGRAARRRSTSRSSRTPACACAIPPGTRRPPWGPSPWLARAHDPQRPGR